MVTRAFRWWGRRDPEGPRPPEDRPDPAWTDPGRPGSGRRPDAGRSGAAVDLDRSSSDDPRALAVGDPSIRFSYPEVPDFLSPRPRPAEEQSDPGRTVPPWATGDPATAARPWDTGRPTGPRPTPTLWLPTEPDPTLPGPPGPGGTRPGSLLRPAEPAGPSRYGLPTADAGFVVPAGATPPSAAGTISSWPDTEPWPGPAEPGPAQVVADPVADPAVERALVREAVGLVDDQDRLIRDFYHLIFAMGGPDVIAMFPTDLNRQRTEFGRALVQWVSADDPETLAAHLDQLGADHRKFDVEPAHYAVAGEALVAAVRGRSGGRFSPVHEQALRGSYGRLATVMIDGALRRIADPPYWSAEVVDHQRLQDDFAVVTVQPAAPYPFRAGQYTTVELAGRPRLWRQMSIASAPRANNTFDLHVRAVPGGDVSGALVRHTRPGDQLRVGPARGGALVVEPGTVTGLLCVAAGTGAAPIAAVVESVLAWRQPPPLYAYVGARTAEDLYPVHYLAPRTAGRTDVQVVGVVSGEPDFPGLRGRVEDVVPDLAPWADLGVDVLVAGPTRMMDRTVRALHRVGVPPERIHFDQYETTDA